MKKTTKLLSVILAFVMVLSCMTMMASAAKEKYQTVADLEGKNAYSPYGTVTRLDTETRMSIIFDFLDQTLAPLNITLSQNLSILGTLNVDLRSVNGLCSTVDSIDTLLNGGFSGFLVSLLKGSLGILADLNVKNWQNGMTREKNTNLQIAGEIFKLLSDNSSLVNSVLTDGLDLGLIGSFLKGVDFTAINNLVTNLPGAINSIALPLMGRPDDDADQRAKLSNKQSSLIEIAQSFVNGLFTKPMAWTSYRVGASGDDLGYTLPLPTQEKATSRYFVLGGDTITQYDYQYAGILGDPVGGEWVETVTYTKTKEYDSEDCTTYVYRAPEGYSGDQTLKWYKSENKADANGDIQSGYWLPSVKTAFDNGDLTLAINGADSLLGLLYKFIPYIFAEMAPTVLNGSAKKLIAEAFDVSFEKIGVKGDAAVQAVASSTGDPDSFFTKDQKFYIWEYSDYKVIDGVPYYRYQDTYFKGEIPNNISAYYNIFNWDWNVGDDFFNEFIPKTVGSTWALDSLNNIIGKAINTMIAETWTSKGTQYNRSDVFNWQSGGNEKLLDNLMNCARAFFKIAPEEIVDEYVEEAQFYNAMMNGTKAEAVNGLVCELVKLIMPQIAFPDNIVDEPITAIAALVVRELCTQLMPRYNFDAMIFANYGDSSNNTREIASHTADEWLDITIYMGVNLGMYYLRNIADVGEDSDTGYYSVMESLGALPKLTGKNTTEAGEAITFTANSYKATGGMASWLVAVDWIIDWALDVDTSWCWHFGRLVDVEGEVNLATYQNPFNKINSVLLTFIPELENLLNVSGFAGTDYGSGTWLEKILKDGLVDSIVNLDVPSLLSLFKIPEASVLRQNNIADNLVKLIVTMLNSITKKVTGGAKFINDSQINSIETLLNHANLRAALVNIVGLLNTAYTNGLLEPILPIANFFVGWTTDPQKFADPLTYFTNDWGSTYFYSENHPVMHITNSSSGMLLKHRNSNGKNDSAYSITIDKIDFDNGLSTTFFVPVTIAPGETKDIPLTIPAYNGTAKIKLTYRFTGKDGKPLGGERTSIKYVYCSDVVDNLNDPYDSSKGLGETITEKDNTGQGNYRKYEFTEDIYTAITTYQGTVVSTSNVISRSPKDQYTDAAPTAPASDYFEHLNDVGASGFEKVSSKGASSGYMYKAKAGVTAETEFPYGTYDMGIATIKYNNSGKPFEVDFIYYNDFDVDQVAEKYLGYNLKAEDFVDQSLWNKYEEALMKVVALAGTAKRTDYVETIQPQIEPAIQAIDEAYENLINSKMSKTAVTIDDVQNKLNSLETNPDRDINYQDYALFEYFKYENERTAAREMIKASTAPSAPEKYIENGVWGNALVEAIANAQANANVKAGINATVVEPTKEEMADYQTALADFVAPEYTDLQVQNQTAMLQYYYDFMIANAKVVDKTFLQKEIAYAEGQKYEEGKYSADSWSRYTEALANAKAVETNGSAKESEVFDAKYELMVAQNKLQLKERSMKEVGYMNQELVPLIEHANAIIKNYGTIYNVKSGVEYEDAFAQLVSALGVKYDVNVADKQYAGILYDRSALTFTEYDRTATAKNKRAVDAIADKLRAAIENFESTVKLESNNGESTVDQAVRYIEGIEPNSIPTVESLLEKVKVTGNAAVKPVVTASKAGAYGTGTRVELKNGDELLATYFLVIYGDVNGDGAIDAFDAIEVDNDYHTAYYIGDVYDDAADIDHNGIIDSEDYSAIKECVKCAGTISQG